MKLATSYRLCQIPKCQVTAGVETHKISHLKSFLRSKSKVPGMLQNAVCARSALGSVVSKLEELS